MTSTAISFERQRRMGRALFLSSLLSEPLFTLYGLLSVILYKDLGASSWQISLLIMLKPVITSFSFYWSAGKRNLRSNVLWAGFWMRTPFLFCPWIDSSWFMIAAAVNYMFFYRAGIPGWVEMLKQNMEEGKRGRAFSLSSGLAYAEGIVLSIAMGALLDHNPLLWKALFFGSALVGLLVLLVQARIPVTCVEREEEEKVGWKEQLIQPWRDSFHLLKKRPDFARFQWGFMVCGVGIMLIQPVLPLFMVDFLGISYVEMAAAISIAKGLGFALSSPVWGSWMEKIKLSRLAGWVFLSFGFFPLLLSLSLAGWVWFYVAYLWYGVGQGGSHLVWNLSGPFFSKEEESSRYTRVNIVLAGLRGAVAPPLGGLLAVYWNPIGVLILGGALCLYSGAALLQKETPEKIPS